MNNTHTCPNTPCTNNILQTILINEYITRRSAAKTTRLCYSPAPVSCSQLIAEMTRWAPGNSFNLVALDCPNVKCNAPGRASCNHHAGSRAHPDEHHWSRLRAAGENTREINRKLTDLSRGQPARRESARIDRYVRV